MDDEDVERILKSVEEVYGKDIMKIGVENPRFRRITLSSFLYGNKTVREKKIEDAQKQGSKLIGPYRVNITNKQYEPLSDEWVDKYSEK